MFWFLMACKQYSFKYDQCQSRNDCTTGFGQGATCESEGFCSPLTIHPRCDFTIPADYFTNPAQYDQDVVVGHIYDWDREGMTTYASMLAAEKLFEVDDGTWNEDTSLVMVFCNIQDTDDRFDDNLTKLEAVDVVTNYLTNTLEAPLIVGPIETREAQKVLEVSQNKAVVISPTIHPSSLRLNSDSGEQNLFWSLAGTYDQMASAFLEILDNPSRDDYRIIMQDNLLDGEPANTISQQNIILNGQSSNIYSYLASDAVSLSTRIEDVVSLDDTESILFLADNEQDIHDVIMKMLSYPDVQLYIPYSYKLTNVLVTIIADSTSGNIPFQIRDQLVVIAPKVLQTTSYVDYRERFTELQPFPLPEVFIDMYLYGAFAYDATWITGVAYEWGKASNLPFTPQNLSEVFSNISNGSNTPMGWDINWGKMVEEFQQGNSVDLSYMVSGNLDIDTEAQTVTTTYLRYKIAGDFISFEEIE